MDEYSPHGDNKENNDLGSNNPKSNNEWDRVMKISISKSEEDINKLDPDEETDNMTYQVLLQKIQHMYDTLPSGWIKNDKVGSKSNEAPFLHEDGRISWKHPNSDEINALIYAAKAIEEEEIGLVNNSLHESLHEEKETKKDMIDKRLLKKYRLMVKRGVPVGAVKQNAKVIDGIELDDSDLLDNKNNQENETKLEADASGSHEDNATINEEKNSFMENNKTMNSSQNLYKYFKPLNDGALVELMVSTSGDCEKETFLARVVQKLVLTVNKSRGGYTRTSTQTESTITASTHDLYNALGALRGVRFSRELYNSTCGNCSTLSVSERKSKRKPFLELSSSLGFAVPASEHEQVEVKGLNELINFIEAQYHKKLAMIKDKINVGMYDFDCLSDIYLPGSRVIAKNVFASGVDMICEVSWNRFEEGKTLFGLTRSFKVCFQFIVAVGEHFTMCEYVESIENFDGRKHIQSLNFVPLQTYESGSLESILAGFRSRGEMYARCAIGSNFMSYDKGSFFAKGGKSSSGGDLTAALRLSGRVMVDTQGSYDNGYSISIGNDSIITDIKQKYKEYMLLMRSQKKKAKHNMEYSNVMNDDTNNMVLFDKIPSDYLEMTWPALVGFSFTSRCWGEILVDGLSEVQFNELAFDNLVLPQSRKRMVKALVRHSKSGFNDIISGKGEGSVFLLYGPPGCGECSVVLFYF
jgi:hypothetical protein